MALPVGVTSFTLTFGAYTTATGLADLVASGGKLMAVDPSTNRPIRLVHVATGQVLTPTPIPITVASDGTATVTGIPHTGQASLSPVGYAWRVEWNIASRKPSPGNLTFVVDSGATADFDLLVPAETVPAVAISQPTVASVAGLTGSPTAQELVDALETALDAWGGGTDPGYDIVPLLGQSNMSGRGGAAVTLLDPTDPKVWQYATTGTYADQISVAADPLGHSDGVSAELGPAMTFARWYATTLSRGRRVLLVPLAQGNTSMTTWGVGGTLYNTTITQVNKALVAGGAGSRVAAILWHQGEASTGSTEAAYATALDAVIAGLRTAFGEPDLPFIVGQMVPDTLTDTGKAGINRAHVELPERVADTGFAAGPFTGINDIHYAAANVRILGRRYFDELVRIQAGDAATIWPETTEVPVPVVSAFTDTTMTLSWPATALAVRYRVEREGPTDTWTLIGFTTNPTIAMTGLTASTSYKHRVWALGQGGPSPTAGQITASTAGATAPPTALTITATPGDTQVVITKTGGTGTGVTYALYRSATVTGSPIATTFPFTDTGRTNGVAYDYIATATNVGGTVTSNVSTATPTGGGPTTYAADTFTRADNAASAGSTETGGYAWTPSSGNTYGILTNQLRTVAATVQPAHCLIDDGQADGTLKVTIKTASTLSAGISFRVSADGTTGYVFYHSNTGAYTIRRRSGTTYTTLATGTGPTAAVNDIIEVVLNGSSITCRQNGSDVATATDATYTGTRHGVMSVSSNQPLFDDFSHTSATA